MAAHASVLAWRILFLWHFQLLKVTCIFWFINSFLDLQTWWRWAESSHCNCSGLSFKDSDNPNNVPNLMSADQQAQFSLLPYFPPAPRNMIYPVSRDCSRDIFGGPLCGLPQDPTLTISLSWEKLYLKGREKANKQKCVLHFQEEINIWIEQFSGVRSMGLQITKHWLLTIISSFYKWGIKTRKS